MSDSKNDPWLCYGDYVCLSTRAGKDSQERKYLLGHSSPLMRLQKLQTNQSATDFASIILAENPATIAFADKPETSTEGTLDMITNARDYWFEVLPRTDYDMSSQLATFKKQLSEANKRLAQFETKKKDVLAKRKDYAASTAQSALTLNFASTSDIHMSSKPPNDAVVKVGDSSIVVEMQRLNSASGSVSPAEVDVKVIQSTAIKGSALSMLSLPSLGNRRQSVQAPDGIFDIERDISMETAVVEDLKAKVKDYRAKTKQEQNGNLETIKRMHGDPLTYGSVIQLSHVNSKRLLTITKLQDRPIELAEYGKSGSLFFIERVSTGVAGGSAKIPAQGNISVRFKSFVSDSQYMRMEPNNSMVPGTKFGVSLDVELDGVFNADESFQLGTGAASNDNRVDWIIERCRKNSKVSGISDDQEDVAEDDGVAVHEVLSGCQIIRLYHRSSESYLAATATKMDRGKVFWSHRSQSDASQGSGKIANTYWMVTDGDGDMADAGEDVSADSPVILQHVVSGMVLVCIRHLPAVDSFKATYDEEYLSDDEELENAFDDEDEKRIMLKRDELKKWIQTIRASVSSVLDYCNGPILPTNWSFIDLCNVESNLMFNAPLHTEGGRAGDEHIREAEMATYSNAMLEFQEYLTTAHEKYLEFNQDLVQLWHYRGETLSSMLKDATKFLFEGHDLTIESIKIKALEIEYELSAWFRMPVYAPDSGFMLATEVIDFALAKYVAEDTGDHRSQSGRSLLSDLPSQGGPPSISGISAYTYGTQMAAEKQNTSSVTSAPDSAVVHGTGSAIRATGSRTSASETASRMLNDKSAKHPLQTLGKIISLFKERDKKDTSSTSNQNQWTMHVMTPKRLRTFRAKFEDRFSSDTIVQVSKENTSMFLLACRWSFSTRHDISERKVDGHAYLSNNTLFCVEAHDCKDSIVILGIDLSGDSSLSASTTKRANISMVQLGAAPDKKKLESPVLQQFENQLCNIEFVSPKNADKIRNGAQVSSIIRNFCAHLKFSTDKRDLNDSDHEYYMAFVRRYNSRLQEAFDVVAKSCLIDGFQPEAISDEVDSQGQLFFGSLGIVELAFSVIQPLTEQLGWQMEEEPPFFTHWKVRPYHAKVLHYCLEAISATTKKFPKNKADDFFKKWRQRRDKDLKPWADKEMVDATREVLEELGFPLLRNEAGVEVPRVSHNIFKLFAESMRLRIESWTEQRSELKIPQNISPRDVAVSPKAYAEAVMVYNFPNLRSQDYTKKVEAVERNFRLAFVKQHDDDKNDEEATAYTQNDELLDSLKYAMKPSDFDFFCNKHVEKAGLYAFKAIVSPVQASRIRTILDSDAGESERFGLNVKPGQQMFYLFKEHQEGHPLGDHAFSNVFKAEYRSTLEAKIKDGKVLEFDKEKVSFTSTDVSNIDREMIKMIWNSQQHLADILKCVALDDDNSESPWNDLPIFFNFKDPVKYSDFRPTIIDIIRKACSCVANLLRGCQENSKKINSSQVYYVIKNLLPKSSANQLNIASMLSSILKGNFSAIDRMFTDAVYSSLLQNMNDLRSNAVPIILQSLVVNRDGTPDYSQQMRVLKSIFQNPYKEGRVLVPRIPSSYVGGTFKSLRLVFDSTYGLAKMKNEPTPKDHPFAYINPPPWAKSSDDEKRFFIEAWDVLVPVESRSGALGNLYGQWCPPRFFELKAFANDFDCLEEFGYFSEIKKIEKEWNEVHMTNMGENSLSIIERDLKRDWWYCTMKLHVQFLCSCYSLVAKLCANRNQQAWNFFFGMQVQTKEQFLTQSWGSRPTESIVRMENDGAFISHVSFGVDGFSTVAAVTNTKPMNPSCAYEIQWPNGRFMYYEVTIESFDGPEAKAMLQLGWTVASKERNADQPSDGDGAGDFAHNWGVDGIRTVTYADAMKLQKLYEDQIKENRTVLMNLLPEAESLSTSLEDLHGTKLQEYLDAISAFWDAKSDSMRKSFLDEEEIAKNRRVVERAKHMVRSKVSHRKNIMAQMAVAERKFKAKDAKEQNKEDKLESSFVDRGLLCFHCIMPLAEIPDTSSAFLSDVMEKTLKNTPVNKKAGQPSLKWAENTVIGVWYDYDTCEMGIVRSEQSGGKQTLFRRSDTAFFDDLNSVTWREDDIVPCISGKGVNIKVNFGILEGEGNKFKYFDSQKLTFIENIQSSLFEISEIKDGKMITSDPHNLKNGQHIRLDFAKTSIDPLRYRSPFGELIADRYTCVSHNLQNNQMVSFIDQESSSNGIEEGQVYLVQVENENDFFLRKMNIKERVPYMVRILEGDTPHSFEILRVGSPDETFISDALQLPRVYLNGRISRATWGGYGGSMADVTDIYNSLFEDGLRNIGNLEAVCEPNSVLYNKWEQKTTKGIETNLKYFFKPERVAIQASEHHEKKGLYICENHGLKRDQFVEFGVQDQPNSIIVGQAYTVNLDNISDSGQFRLTIFCQNETCFLRVFYSLNLPDTLIGDSKLDLSRKNARIRQKSLKYATCLGYSPPSSLTSQKIPNFAFSNGVEVIPGYSKLSDIVFCSFLPTCLRSSCVELLRACFIDQEPWFLTPPINTIRAISAEPAASPLKFSGGYPGKSFREFASIHGYKIGKELPELADDFFGYREDDEKFFQDIFDAAAWEQEEAEYRDPKNFSGKNWSDGSPVRRGQVPVYEPLRNFLLGSYRAPKSTFELSTRDIAIFWGRCSCLLWEESLKSRFLSEKNQDIKLFLKNLIYCLLDTLRFELDESWKGIIKIRNRLVADLELCALSYFQQTDIAHIVADAIKMSQSSASSHSSSEPSATMSRTAVLFSCFRRSSNSLIGADSKDEVKDEEQTGQVRYGSIVPPTILEKLKFVSDQSSDVARNFSDYSRSQGNKESYGYFDWLSLDTTIPDYKPGIFSHNRLKRIFKQASGDLLLSFCELMSVSWQIMVDDKITEFLELCDNWQSESKSLVGTTNYRFADVQSKRTEMYFMKLAKDFCEKEKSNNTKLETEVIDQNDVVKTDMVDWFDVIPSLTRIPKTSNMASKLCIQLHSFPKDVFENIQKTQIVTGQDSAILNKLEVELRTLRILKEEIRLCFFAEDDLLEIAHIPNEVSFNLGESWKCVERLIARLCLEKEYDDSTAEVQSWVNSNAARLFVPCDKEDPRYAQLMDTVDDSGGMPPWDESLEYIEMLHDSIVEVRSKEKINWTYKKDQSPYFMINPEAEPSDQGHCWHEPMKVYSQDQNILQEGEEKSTDTSPCQMEYQCHICNEGGSGYCFCFPEGIELKFVHPLCVYTNNLAGDRFSEPRHIPQGIEEQYKSLYASNKADQDVTWSNERRTLIVEEIKMSILCSCDVDKETKQPQKPYLDSDKSVEPTTKKDQLQKAMMQLGIIDQLIEIVKIPFPKKYSSEQAESFNQKMQKRMRSRRINYSFEKVNATFERVAIVECLMRRVFFLLAQAAVGCSSIQDRLYADVDFFFAKALEPTANDSALCILNMIQGNLDNATSVSTELLVDMVKVAQDGQNPDDILLLAPFMAQGGKNISVNQREILELCIPAEYAVREDCIFVLDSDFPSDSTSKESFEKWKSRITSLHISREKSKFGDNPWDPKEHNWKHLLRVASDIVHGGYASKSEPCRSAFHMAFIQTLMSCGFNNPEERQNIVLRLPFVQILHVLNTVCSVVHHRIWGYSFIERCKSSLETAVQDLVKVENPNEDLFRRDPRLDFLNFDLLLKATASTVNQKDKKRQLVPISVFPLCGLLKFFKCYMCLLSHIHFFNDSGTEDIVRRTPERLPLYTSASKVSGFITWMGLVLKDVVSVFQRKKVSEIMGAGVFSALGSQVSPDNLMAPLPGAGVSDSDFAHGHDSAIEAAALSTRSAPLSSIGALRVISRVAAKAHAFIHARAFADFDNRWFGDHGDISVAEFDNQSNHPIISVALNQIWSKIFGLGVNWETTTMQGLKLGDKLAYDSRFRDIESSPKFCRPFWRCPISYAHFANPNHCVLALAVSCVLFDQVPMDWKSQSQESILGAILNEPMGYKSQDKKRPDVSDFDEARNFIFAIELLIQEMCADQTLRWHNKKPTAHADSYVDSQTEVEIRPIQVLDMFIEGFVKILDLKSFQESGDIFKKHLHKDPSRIETSWPAKLLQSGNETSAIVLIEKKITQWNIIRLFRSSLSNQISVSQAPVIRRCLSFALVYNWGGWGGVGSEISLKQMKLIVESISVALTDICHIAIECLPSFVQQLFQRYEAPKANSPQAKECMEVGDLFLKLAATLQENSTDSKQADCIIKICAKSTGSSGSPVDYLLHVGQTLQKTPKQWSLIEAYSKSVQNTAKIVEPDAKSSGTGSVSAASASVRGFNTELRKISIQDAYQTFLRNTKIQEIISSTVDLNEENLIFRFLAIDHEDRISPVSAEDLPFSFYSKSSLKNSTNRNNFPKYLNDMVYNILSVLGSIQTMQRGEDTNRFITSCLRTLTQVIFCGACVDKNETDRQFVKLAKSNLVLDHENDSESFFARTRHVQECLVGLCWLNPAEIETAKKKMHQYTDAVKNPTLVTDSSYKMALKSFSFVANLVTPAAPNNEIREKALHALSCMLDNCSASVLDRFFDSKDAQVVHSTSNMFARSLQQFMKDYEVFQDRDDDLTIYLQKFRKAAKQLEVAGSSEPSEDEYIRKLIEFETTDWIGDAADAKAKGEPPEKIPYPDANIKAAYISFCSKNHTNCLYSLRLICQMCVQSGKTTRATYSVGQKYMRNQPNSDPALVVDFSSSLNSLGSAIASRMRLAQANVFDIRILCRLFKAYNTIIFGASSGETQGFLVADTFVLINKTISGLSQRIDDIAAPFFPNNHPIYVLEQMLAFLLSFALSDIDGKICKQLSKSISWINFFNLISQMHTTSMKYESSSPTKPQAISAAEYKKATQRISDSAYILYSAVKRRDILKSAQLEKDWRQANLDAVATEAQRRVSCVEIVRTPGCAELCFFSNPDEMNEVGDSTQRQLLCLEDSKQLSLRKNLVICEQLRNRKISGSGRGATFFNFLRNVPLILTTLINLLLLGWLSLPIDFSQAKDGWKWPQDEFLWERLVPNITSEDGSYTYEEFKSNILPNVLPLTLSDEESDEITIYRNSINMTFLLLAGANIFVCFSNLIFWIVKKARVDVYEYLLTSAYEDFVSPSNKSKKKISLEYLQNSAGGSSFLTIFKIPAFWGRLAMMICSLCILFISPLFSVLFVCDGFRFPGISYIFGAFTAKSKEFFTLGYLTASIIFINAVIGLVFFWDLFSSGQNEAGSSECTTLFQCTLSFIVLGWQGGGLSDLLNAAKDTPQGTPTSIGDPRPSSYRLIISLFWQLLYFIIVPTCLVSTVVGIISDSFGDARQKKAEWKDSMAQYCFVCGRSAADFRDAGLVAGLPEESIVTFEEHVTTEHCVKDYFKLFTGVKSNKNPDLLTAQEHFVLQKINSLDESFFPIDLSISLDAMKSFAESESSAAEKQEKRMDGFEGKLVKVAESVEEITSKMVKLDDIKDIMDMKENMMTKKNFEEIQDLLREIKSASFGQD